MDCPEHNNAQLANCPSCLAEYWKCHYETQVTENAALKEQVAQLLAENTRLLAANRDCIDHFDAAYKDLTAEQSKVKVLTDALDTTVKAIMIFRNEPMLERLHGLRSSVGYGVMQQAMDISREALATVKEE